MFRMLCIWNADISNPKSLMQYLRVHLYMEKKNYLVGLSYLQRVRVVAGFHPTKQERLAFEDEIKIGRASCRERGSWPV